MNRFGKILGITLRSTTSKKNAFSMNINGAKCIEGQERRMFSTRACECSCACSTCHVILEPELYDQLEEPTDEEYDMLDLAFGLTETSRLGCQVKVSSLLENAKIKLPSATRNFYVDGSKPTPH
ncbi:Adrenodoxin-like protein 1, mitochondrial [Smittium mucronatum]|uniref:2Fe-2S ferredoxin n=1 Tax=Smittium mucronatum TaxID=133383 RepID=A0A1R0GRW5_9FUNG|nr:Adrenodoxin-like protein 1, mitochondrial [Smittium mucronatum]OLY84597.1 Adrenodoxin-like protein 1, mitochondrial [Smittium mucronatum]